MFTAAAKSAVIRDRSSALNRSSADDHRHPRNWSPDDRIEPSFHRDDIVVDPGNATPPSWALDLMGGGKPIEPTVPWPCRRACAAQEY
jgi:hypothetical protein